MPASAGAEPFRALLVEDCEADALLVERELRRSRARVVPHRVWTSTGLRDALASRWDVALVDYNVPGLEAAQAISAIRSALGDIPIVVVSGAVGEEYAVAAMKSGANDFVTKQALNRLGAAIEREVAEASARREGARARAALHLAEGRLEALAAATDDRIFALDLAGRVVSSAGRPLPPAEDGSVACAGRPLWTVLAEPALATSVASALTGRRVLHEWAVGGAGDERWFQARVSSVFVEDRVAGAVATVREVTELKALQARLAVADRMATIGSIAAAVAHDLCAPAGAALVALEEAGRCAGELALADPRRETLAAAIRDAREASERVRDVAQDVRTFSRGDVDPAATADLRAVLDSAARLASHELRDRATVVREYAEVPRTVGGASRLGQVFLNLVVNAAQAIQPGAPSSNRVVLRTALAPDGRVVAEVTDTGAGMGPEIQRRIFTPFFTTKPEGVGTGLGLSICHRIVSALGGDIQVESRPGRGTTFRVLLPAAREEAPRPPAAARPLPARPGDGAPPARRRILVVDDEVSVHRAMTRLFGKAHEVTCTVAEDALARIGRGERWDLVLSDVSMPGISGVELHRRIEAIDGDQAARIAFLTGGAFDPETAAFLRRPGILVLDKAASPHAVRAAVEARLEVLNAGQPNRSTQAGQ